MAIAEGEIGVCGIRQFSCGVSVILISKCSTCNAVFSEPAG